MAALLAGILEWIPISYLATVRRDGAPRVHPVCPIFAGGRMFAATAADSPKRLDLAGQYFGTALEIFEQDENAHGQALVLRNAAVVDRLRGDFDPMMAKYEQAPNERLDRMDDYLSELQKKGEHR